MKRFFILVMLAFSLSAYACQKPAASDTDNDDPAAEVPDTTSGGGEVTPPQQDTTETPETPDTTAVIDDWVDGYPKGVTVEEFREDFSDGTYCLGFIATIDFAANPDLRFNCVKCTPKKKPSAAFAALPRAKGRPALATNGGYFAGATSVSMVVTNGFAVVPAFHAFNWPNDEEAELTMYPVRSAIGQMADGSFEIQWAYCTDVTTRTHTAYPSWLDNDEKTKTFMAEPPTADVEGAFTWEPQEAIGGGPRLVKDGVNISTDAYWGEALDAGGTSGFSKVNRTAAGITKDGKLILIVVDGRGQRGSAGITLSDLADKFIELGCDQAMNLDGGGSSCMVGTDGAVLNSPSDKAGERAVASCIIISELYD